MTRLGTPSRRRIQAPTESFELRQRGSDINSYSASESVTPGVTELEVRVTASAIGVLTRN